MNIYMHTLDYFLEVELESIAVIECVLDSSSRSSHLSSLFDCVHIFCILKSEKGRTTPSFCCMPSLL